MWCPSQPLSDDPLGLGIKSMKEAGFEHLGSFVGSDDYIREKLDSKVQKIKGIFKELNKK